MGQSTRVGEAFGLDPSVMVDVLNASTGKNNSTEHKLKQFVIPRTYGSGFFIGLMAKDIRTADDLARAMGVPGARVTDMEGFNRRFAEGIGTPGPFLIEVIL